MIFKNILFGIGGSAIVGGVGYGIYSSSQTNENEKLKTDEKEQEKEVGEEDKNGEETQLTTDSTDESGAQKEGGTGTKNTQVPGGDDKTQTGSDDKNT